MDNVRSPIVLIILGRRLSTGRDLITIGAMWTTKAAI